MLLWIDMGFVGLLLHENEFLIAKRIQVNCKGCAYFEAKKRNVAMSALNV